MVQITGELAPPPERVLDLWRLEELRGISHDGGALVLGALTTYTDIRRSDLCHEHLPALVDAAATIGAAQIQNRGTIGGNIANASPAGDTLPVLLATDAEIVLGSNRVSGPSPRPTSGPATGRRRAAPTSWYCASESRFHAGARCASARSARGAPRQSRRSSWRSPGAPTAASGATCGWRSVRLPRRPSGPSQPKRVLEGAAPRQTTAEHAASALANEINPIDDVRSTADYRRAVSARVLHRLLREAGGW